MLDESSGDAASDNACLSFQYLLYIMTGIGQPSPDRLVVARAPRGSLFLIGDNGNRHCQSAVTLLAHFGKCQMPASDGGIRIMTTRPRNMLSSISRTRPKLQSTVRQSLCTAARNCRSLSYHIARLPTSNSNSTRSLPALDVIWCMLCRCSLAHTRKAHASSTSWTKCNACDHPT